MVATVKVRRASSKLLLVLAGLTVVAYIVALGTFDAYVAGTADLLLIATITTGVIALVNRSRRLQRWSLPATLLGFVVAVVVLTGTLKAAWLAANLPSSHDRSSGVPYVLLASLAPISMTITAVILRTAPLPVGRKLVRIEVVGLAVGFLPWIVLMITGIAD